MAKDSEYGGADGQYGNTRKGNPVSPYIGLRSYRDSTGRRIALDENGAEVVRTPEFDVSKAAH